MATFTIDIIPGQNGPSIRVTASQAGHTVIVNDYVHPDAPSYTVVPTVQSPGGKGKQQTFNF